MALLRNPRGQGKFEASCIALHLAQARSNLDDLSGAGQSRGQRNSRSRLCSTPSLWTKTLDEAAIGAPNVPQATDPTPSAGSGAAEPMLNSLPKDFAESTGRGALGELGSTVGLAPMIASIAEGLHEELRGFLASFSSRLAAREAALAATCDRAATAGDYGMTELSRRVEDRLAAVAQSAAAEREAALDVVREALRRVRDEVIAQHARLESLVTGDDWGRQLREATRAFEQRSALRVEAVERHVEELRAKDAAGQRAWRDAVIQRVDAVEKRLSKHFKDSNSVIDQVGKMVPDVERLQSLYDALQADRAAADTWQRRLFNCEAAVQRLAALEAQSNLAERQSERFRDETSQSLRESLHLTGALAARVSTLESSEKSRDEHWKAAEKRVLALVEQNQKRLASGLDIVRENAQQRFTDFDSKSQQRLDRLREDLEQRVIALSQVCKRDIHDLRLDVDKLGQIRQLPTGQAQASYTGVARQSAGTATSAAFVSRTRTACAPQFAHQPPQRPAILVPGRAAPAVPVESSDLPLHAPRAGDQSAQSLGTTRPLVPGNGVHLASELSIAHLPSYETPLLSSAHAATVGGFDRPLRTESAPAQTDAAPAEVSAPNQPQEGSSGRSSLIGVDFNPAQMELEASRVFSDADEWAHASRESTEENAVPGEPSVALLGTGARDHMQHEAFTHNSEEAAIENAASFAESFLPTSADKQLEPGTTTQVGMEDDDDDVEALMAQSMRANRQKATFSGESLLPASADKSFEPGTSAQVEVDGADDDVEALMAQSMRANGQKTTSSGENLLRGSTNERSHPVTKTQTDDAEEDVEDLMARSMHANMQRTTVPGDSLLTASARKSFETGALAQAEMDEDDDDVEALMAQSMRANLQKKSLPGDSLPAASAEKQIETCASAQVNTDDADEDVEALFATGMHANMQRTTISGDSLLAASAAAAAAPLAAPDKQVEPDTSGQVEVDEDAKNDVEPSMAQSMRATEQNISVPEETLFAAPRDHRIEPGTIAEVRMEESDDDVEADDDVDIEALISSTIKVDDADAEDMQKSQSAFSSLGLQGTAGPHYLHAGVSNNSRAASGKDNEEDDIEALMNRSIEKQQSSLSSLALQGKAEMGSLGLRVGSSIDSRKAGSAGAAGAATGSAGAVGATEDNEDSDDVEALMTGSMQKSQSSLSPIGNAGVGSLRLRMGASTDGRRTAAPATAHGVAAFAEDEDEDDVEALMAGSMQKSHSSLSSSALQGQGGMGSLRLRVGASTDSNKKPAAAPVAVASPAAGGTHTSADDDDDDDDDVEALMAGSMQKAQSSLSPSALPVKAGVGGLRLRMGASDGSIGAAGSAAAAGAAAGSVTGAGNEDDDDDEDDIEALMAGSMQAGHAAPGRRRAADMRASSSTMPKPGVQASRQTGRDARMSALLGLDTDEDED